MRDRKKRNIVIGILCCLLVFMGVGYAILSQTLTINGIGNVKGKWNVEITDMKLINVTGKAEEVSSSFTDTSAVFAAKLYLPGDSIEYEVTVTNNGNIDAVLKSITPTITNKVSDIKFSHSKIDTTPLTAGKTITFTMKVEFSETATTTPNIDKSEYTLDLVYVQYDGKDVPLTQPLSDKILADNTAQSDSSIDFSQISSDTNGKGLYYTSTNTEGNATTYYFRGAVDNNYVKFGSQTKNTCRYNGKDVAYFDLDNGIFEYNPTEEQCLSTNVCTNTPYGTIVGIDETTDTKCSDMGGGTLTTEKATFTANVTEDILWRVIRINEDGSTRLITEDIVGGSAFNSNTGDNAYVGYMYGTAGSTTYEATHANTNDSTIKTYLDNWYQENLLSYTSYMSVDAGFCNDRSMAPTANTWSSNDTALGYGTNQTYYGSINRLKNLNQPQFACPQTNDLFTTTTSTKGNKALTYPVGLITADEVVYAGSLWNSTNTSYYLYNSTYYWTISSGGFDGAPGFILVNTGSGVLGFETSYTANVRPVINLASYVEVTSGDGTVDNPYIVK